jgi:hypothetical protein
MISKLGIIAAFVLAYALCEPAWGQGSKDWIDVQGASALHAAVAGKTFKDGWGTVRAFRSDGKGIFVMSSGTRILNTWAVKGQEKICATPQKGETECWRVRRSRGDQNMVSFTFDNQVIVAYKVTDGVPTF